MRGLFRVVFPCDDAHRRDGVGDDNIDHQRGGMKGQ